MQHFEQNFLFGFIGGLVICFIVGLIFIKNKQFLQKLLLYFPFICVVAGLFANIPRLVSFGKLDYVFFLYPLVNSMDPLGKLKSFIVLIFLLNAIILYYLILLRGKNAAA